MAGKRSKLITTQQFKEGIDALINGANTRQVGATWGVSYQTVTNWINEFYDCGYDFKKCKFLKENYE